jgi:tripartite-type tricarboxylate transporter receptor subunit TctC
VRIRCPRSMTVSKMAVVKMSLAATAACLSVLLPAIGAARADDYPSRTVNIIVPYPAGGGVDAMARMIAEKLSTSLKGQFVVDNRGGGGGNIGMRSAARAQPDGYTLLLGHTGTMAINPNLYENPGYDPKKDFAPLGLVATFPVALLAHPSFPAKTLKEAIALAKKNPGKYNMGTSALGTGGYMSAEYFKAEAGVDMQIVPYKGTGPLMNDLLGGHVPVAFGVLPPAMGNIEAGNLRAIAVTGLQRFSLLPDVPTADESGLPGFDAVLRYGLLAPAGTPQPIRDMLSKELRAMASDPEMKKRINAEGGDPLSSTPEEHAQDIDRELTKWGTLVKKLNLKIN